MARRAGAEGWGEAARGGALLDVNLASEPCFPIAAILKARGVPFMFLTGYDDLRILPAEYYSAPRLAKPFDEEELVRLVARTFHPIR